MRIFVDAMWVVYKTLYKMDWLHTSRGVPTGMEYGFLRIMQSMKQFEREIVLCWDSKSVRHDWYDGYKLSRNNKPIDGGRLEAFVQMTKKVFPWAKKDGLEADDVIASLVREGDWIHTRDKDMFQLLSMPDVKILYSWTKEPHMWDKNYVYGRYGVWPEHMPMYQAITGDSCDRIPGCKGVNKTDVAWSITNNNGSLQAVLCDGSRLDGAHLLRLRKFVESGEYERNLKLVTLIKDPDVQIIQPEWDETYLKNWFQDMEIFSLELCQHCGFMPEF